MLYNFSLNWEEHWVSVHGGIMTHARGRGQSIQLHQGSTLICHSLKLGHNVTTCQHA